MYIIKLNFKGAAAMAVKIPVFHAKDTLELKKPHPCGCRLFTCVRVGSDCRIICQSCGRDMTLPREKLERAIKKIIPHEDDIPHKSE